MPGSRGSRAVFVQFLPLLLFVGTSELFARGDPWALPADAVQCLLGATSQPRGTVCVPAARRRGAAFPYGGGGRSYARAVFFSTAHVCRSGRVYAYVYFFSSRVWLEQTACSCTPGPENKQQQQKRGSKQRRGRGASAVRAAVGPRLLRAAPGAAAAAQQRVGMRHLEGEGEGGLFLPFVCVWEGE